MQKKIVAVMPKFAGLGNRLRGFLGLRSLADLEGREFSYYWPTSPYFGARLSDLYVAQDQELSWPALRALTTFRHIYRDPTLAWLDDRARQRRVWTAATGHEVLLPSEARPWAQYLREWQLTTDLAQRVEELHSRFGGDPYIGVMIRCHPHSHAETLKHSPVSWFHGRLQQLIESHGTTRLYVSCDVPEVKESILADYPGAIGQHFTYPYASRDAIRASLVDVYMLASSSHVLGPHYSSFPELAIHLAGERLKLETSMNGSPAPFELVSVPDPLRPDRA